MKLPTIRFRTPQMQSASLGGLSRCDSTRPALRKPRVDFRNTGIKVRIANLLGTATVALCVVILPGVPAMAETGGVPVLAADSDVPDLQEVAENPNEIDPGEAVPSGPTAVDVADVGAMAPTVCEPNSSSWSWPGKKTPWTVTHAKGYENFSGSAATYTKSATVERTIQATASVTQGAIVGADVIIAKLDGQVSYSLALAGTKTNTGSESVTATMRPGGVYIYYAGARKVSSPYTYSVCNSNGTAVIVKSRGKATSWGLKREGAVRCNSAVAGNSLGYVAERDYC